MGAISVLEPRRVVKCGSRRRGRGARRTDARASCPKIRFRIWGYFPCRIGSPPHVHVCSRRVRYQQIPRWAEEARGWVVVTGAATTMERSTRDRRGAVAQVLCVDDDGQNLLLLTSFLSAEGYVCRTARNGAEALSMLRARDDVDLVITDLMMPVMDGHALCSAIERDFPGLKVIVVSASSEQEMAPLRERPAVRDVLSKPLRRGDLVSVVEYTLAG